MHTNVKDGHGYIKFKNEKKNPEDNILGVPYIWQCEFYRCTRIGSKIGIM